MLAAWELEQVEQADCRVIVEKARYFLPRLQMVIVEKTSYFRPQPQMVIVGKASYFRPQPQMVIVGKASNTSSLKAVTSTHR